MLQFVRTLSYQLVNDKLRKGSRKKSYFLSGRATKRGGVNGSAHKEKRTSFFNFREKVLWPLSLSGQATKP